jgi:hypothetical protein
LAWSEAEAEAAVPEDGETGAVEASDANTSSSCWSVSGSSQAGWAAAVGLSLVTICSGADQCLTRTHAGVAALMHMATAHWLSSCRDKAPARTSSLHGMVM